MFVFYFVYFRKRDVITIMIRNATRIMMSATKSDTKKNVKLHTNQNAGRVVQELYIFSF